MKSIKSDSLTTTKDFTQVEHNVLKSIMGEMDCYVTVRDTDYNLIYQNAYVTKHFGDHLGEKCYRVFQGLENNCPDCPAGSAYRDGLPHKIERELKDSSGETTFREITAYPIKDDNDELVSCVEINRDITKQKKEEAVRSLNIQLTDCANNSENLADLIGKATKCIADSTGFEAIGIRLQSGDDFPYYETRGFPAEFVLAENNLCEVDAKGSIATDSDGNPVIECMCGNVICGRTNPDFPFFTKNGSFWSNCTTELLASTSEEDRQARTRNRCNGEGYESVALIPLGVGGKNFGLLQLNDKRKDCFSQIMISNMEEVASQLSVAIERQLSLDKLTRTEEDYRTVADFTYDWEMWETPEGKFRYVSPACERISGYPREKFIDNPNFLRSLILEEDIATWEALQRRKLEKTGLCEIQFRIKHKDGEIVWIERACQPVVDKNGNFKGYRSSSRDITARKEMEEKLSRKEKLEGISLLASGLAHDFNNILGGSLGYISLAIDEVDTQSELHKLLEAAEQSIIKAAKLTQKLITFSKGGAPQKARVVISVLVRESAEFALSGSNIKCDFDFPKQLAITEIDINQFNQVVREIVINSRQAMTDGGIIDISIKQCHIDANNDLGLAEGRYLKLAFADTGPGMSSEELKKCFDPFYSTRELGRGLGLSTALSVITQHGGNINVQSPEAGGTRVTIYLPSLEENDGDRASIQKTKSRPSFDVTVTATDVDTDSARVLVMDDEAVMRDVITRILSRSGYVVECTSCTKDAVAIYEKAIGNNRPFDLVILDLTIPGEDGGTRAVRRLKEINPDVKAIVCSGYSGDPVMANFKDYGFCSAVRKPFKPQYLINIVKKVLKAEN